MALSIVLSLLILSCFSKTINLKPGKTMTSESVEMDGIVCQFEALVDGGTNENWELTLEKSGNVYACTVSRDRSYLYFSHFKLGFESHAQIYSPEVYNPNKALIDLKYLVNDPQFVRSKSEWTGGINSIRVFTAGEKTGL